MVLCCLGQWVFYSGLPNNLPALALSLDSKANEKSQYRHAKDVHAMLETQEKPNEKVEFMR